MGNLKETKGYANFKGVISGLHNRKKGSSRSDESWGTKLRFFIQTSEHNSIPVEITQWSSQIGKPVYFSNKSEDGSFETKKVDWSQRKEEFEGWNLIGVSARGKDQDDVTTLVPLDAIEYIENNFTDGDNVFVSCKINRSQSGDKSYINYEINRIYGSKEEFSYEAEDFVEVTDFKETIVYDSSFADKKENKLFVNAKTIQYGEKVTPAIFTVWANTDEDKEVANYIAKNCKFGDILTVSGIVHNRVVGEWVENTQAGGVVGRQSKTFQKSPRTFITKGELKEYQIIGIDEIVQGAYTQADFEQGVEEDTPSWLK